MLVLACKECKIQYTRDISSETTVNFDFRIMNQHSILSRTTIFPEDSLTLLLLEQWEVVAILKKGISVEGVSGLSSIKNNRRWQPF